MEKNLNTEITNINLLESKEYKTFLQFEAEYSGIVRGGHSPYYLKQEKVQRIANDVNILSSSELQDLINYYFTGKN